MRLETWDLGLWTAASLSAFALVACAGQWTPTTPLPDGYTDHALAFSSGYLYQLGGNGQTNGILAGFTAHFAQFHADGNIGAWSNTTALPVATTYHAGVAANGYLYVLGGYDYSDSRGVFITDAVYYSRINADGTIGAWLTANPLPSPVYSLAAAVWKGRLYVSGGYDQTNVSAAVYSCRIQADGSLSPWLAQPPLP